MKTIKDVDAAPESFEEDAPAEIVAQIPSYRKLFKAAIGLCIAKNADESIDLIQVGLKFKGIGDVVLEDAEFKLLKDKCAENPAKWIAHYHGQVMLKIKESE